MSASVYFFLFVFSFLSLIGVAIYGWRYRYDPTMKATSITLFLYSLWPLAHIFDVTTADLALKIFLMKARLIPTNFGALGWLAIAAYFTNQRQWLSRKRLIGLAIIPIVTSLLLITGPDTLVRFDYHVNLNGPFPILEWQNGPVMNLYVLINDLTFCIGGFLLWRSQRRVTYPFNRQIAVIGTAVFFPFMTELLFQLGLSPLPDFNLTPVVLGVTGLLLTWGILGYNLVDIAPIARNVVIENLSDGVLVLNAKMIVVDVNPAAQRILNRSREQIIRQPFDKLLQMPGSTDLAGPQIDQRAEIHLEIDQTPRHYEIQSTPLVDRRSDLLGRIITLRDISDRKQIEADLRKQAEELNARNTELDAFAHTVAHDLKSPVSTIIGFSELLLSKDYMDLPREDMQQAIANISKSAHKLDRIIEELMLLTGVRQQTVSLVPINLGETVAEAMRNLSTLIQKTGAQIYIRDQSAWPQALGHAPWIEEVWVNYLSNAMKYGGQPPVIELGVNLHTHDRVRCWVRDNGNGLTPADYNRLFTPFTRLDQIRAGGHGLGLSIVKRIMEKVGGDVGVESTIGNGSTFYFVLPIDTSNHM